MAILLIVVFFVLPPLIYSVLLVYFDAQISLTKFMVTAGLIAFSVIMIGHNYYKQQYGLPILPNVDSVVTSVLFATGVAIVTYVADLIKWLFKRHTRLTMKTNVLAILLLSFLLVLVVPLASKFDYGKRLQQMETNFSNSETELVVAEDDLMITLAASKVSPYSRRRYSSSRTYYSYFYLQNNGDDLFRGQVYLLLEDDSHRSLGVELIQNIEVGPQETILLVSPEVQQDKAIWEQASLRTQAEVVHFDAVIVIDD